MFVFSTGNMEDDASSKSITSMYEQSIRLIGSEIHHRKRYVPACIQSVWIYKAITAWIGTCIMSQFTKLQGFESNDYRGNDCNIVYRGKDCIIATTKFQAPLLPPDKTALVRSLVCLIVSRET